ncbi:MAG: hypothetical protein QM750_19855 [Rubrivivax sp.]
MDPFYYVLDGERQYRRSSEGELSEAFDAGAVRFLHQRTGYETRTHVRVWLTTEDLDNRGQCASRFEERWTERPMNLNQILRYATAGILVEFSGRSLRREPDDRVPGYQMQSFLLTVAYRDGDSGDYGERQSRLVWAGPAEGLTVALAQAERFCAEDEWGSRPFSSPKAETVEWRFSAVRRNPSAIGHACAAALAKLSEGELGDMYERPRVYPWELPAELVEPVYMACQEIIKERWLANDPDVLRMALLRLAHELEYSEAEGYPWSGDWWTMAVKRAIDARAWEEAKLLQDMPLETLQDEGW